MLSNNCFKTMQEGWIFSIQKKLQEKLNIMHYIILFCDGPNQFLRPLALLTIISELKWCQGFFGALSQTTT